MSLKGLLNLFVMMMSFHLSALAQSSYSNIEVREKGRDKGYYYEGEKLNYREMGELMKGNAVAFENIKSAQANNSAAQVFSFAGGFLIGWPIGGAIAGDNPNWTLAAVGAGLVLVSIPFAVQAKNKSHKAIDEFNGETMPLAKNAVHYSLDFKAAAMSLTVRF